MPNVVVIAGPNGAGKSTVAPALLHAHLGIGEFVNADVIARGLSAFDPERAALQAGRVMLARLRELADQRADFAFETTLASRTFAPWIASLQSTGYSFQLLYVAATTPDCGASSPCTSHLRTFGGCTITLAACRRGSSLREAVTSRRLWPMP